MEFYKIENPTTKQIFDAIINNEYIPIEKIQPKAKQIKVLLLNNFGGNVLLVTFKNVTNTGGYPVFFSDNCSLLTICSEGNGWYDLSEQAQEEEMELLACYIREYDDIFNLKILNNEK